jgi:DNA polymerase III subunit chi
MHLALKSAACRSVRYKPREMTEVLFYHLERQPVDQILPGLLEKTLERGWRAVVQVGSPERLDALDTLLWTYKPDSFLPHSTETGEQAARHPVVLSLSEANPNAASVKFLVDGAELGTIDGFNRVVLMFDGRVEAAVLAARKDWKSAKAAGGQCTYWQQTLEGRWEKKG